jgi:hypothetical protein
VGIYYYLQIIVLHCGSIVVVFYWWKKLVLENLLVLENFYTEVGGKIFQGIQ